MRSLPVPQWMIWAMLGVLLPGVGFAIEGLQIQPTRRAISGLYAERAAIQRAATDRDHREREALVVAELLAAQGLATDSLGTEARDATAYLGQRMEECELTRLELTLRGSERVGHLRRTRFVVRVLGGFEGILAFVRRLERGVRLVQIEGFTLEATGDRRLLEARCQVALYETTPGEGP